MGLDVQQLRDAIDYHYDLYNDPEAEVVIPDPDYDQLIEQLRVVDPTDPRLSRKSNLVTGRGFVRAKVSHAHNPCYSLDKVYSFKEILDFARKVARSEDELFDIEVKLDGLTGSLTNGVLATSGDGLVGQDISDKLEIIEIEHANGSENVAQDLRGEIIMKKSVFRGNQHLFIRKSNGKPYKIPRSACVAQVMQEDHVQGIGKFLSFVVFGRFQKTVTLAELHDLDWDAMAHKAQNELDYPADGLVLKLHDRKYLESLGATSHHRKGEIAFKFANPTGETVLIDIERSVGKGKITPVGIVEPVEIDGVMNTRISLHNSARMKEKGVFIGARVLVERCGAIIPGLKKVLSDSSGQSLPDMSTCPACGGPVVLENEVEYCKNENCSGTLSRQIYDAVVRIGIENLGLSTVEKMMGLGVENLIDVLKFTKEQALELDGFAELSASNLLGEIEKVQDRPVEDWRILSSLNITGIGTRVSKKILGDRTFVELQQMSVEELMEIDGIGEVRARLIHLTLEQNVDYIDRLIALFPEIINTVDQNVEVRGRVCFTGKTPVKSETRDKYWKPLAERSGFEFRGSVTKDLDYLVTNDVDGSSSKLKKARSFGSVKIVTYSEFEKLCA